MMEKSAVPYDTISTNSVSTEPMFSKCCCCIPLRVGCFILGYLSLFVNTVRTLFIVGITLYCSLRTHGFDHVDSDPDDHVTAIDRKLQDLDQQTLQYLAWGLFIMTTCDLIWLAVTIACLVGIHKKRPGPIRVYVGIATFRLIVTLASYAYQWSTVQNASSHNVIVHCFDLALTTYFIFVYYMYAVRLEKEAQLVSQERQSPINDASYIYPTKLDKKHLVV